jgi:hypothetical protein
MVSIDSMIDSHEHASIAKEFVEAYDLIVSTRPISSISVATHDIVSAFRFVERKRLSLH